MNKNNSDLVVKKILYFEELPSTSDYLRGLLPDKVTENIAVAAKKQSQGKGSGCNKWLSPLGGLYFSILLKQEKPCLEGFSLFISAVILKTLSCLYSVELLSKWPNDIYYQGRKLGGILCEVLRGYLIIGIGLNVNIPEVLVKEQFRIPPIFLEEINGVKEKPFSLIKPILLTLEKEYPLYIQYGFPYFKPFLEKHSFLIGKKVYLADNKKVTGIVGGYNEQGHLNLIVSDQELKTIAAGTVIVVD